jgi:cellulose synthase/poly-beta-1,6-N-acetylglucosamine synthase-like glycosyltransferase
LSVGGFPEIFTNEDLPLGYFLALAGERICPVAALENSQSPTTISSVITQYTTWFYGAMDYFSYYRYAVDRLYFSKYKALFWAMVNSVRAAVWLLAPWVWLVLFTVPLFFGIFSVFILAFCVFLLHTAFVYWIIARFISKNPNILGKKTFSVIFEYGMITAVPIAYFIWGIGPTRAFAQVMIARLLRKKIYKSKTER